MIRLVRLNVGIVLAVLAVTVGGLRSLGSQSQVNAGASASQNRDIRVRPLTDLKFERTPERLARGRYLVNGIGECFACHGPSDFKGAGWPPIRGKQGSGFKFSWWVAPNLTPDRETGAGDWTDDMLARAIREGVAHDGHLLDPTIMPYEFYRSMSDEDLASIIVYLRSLPAIRNELPPMKPRKDVVAPYAAPINAPIPQPDVSTSVKRGAYIPEYVYQGRRLEAHSYTR